MSVTEAAESGTYRDLLVALRDRIATTIDDGCAARDLVGLSKRLVDLTAELRALDLAEDEDKRLRLVPNADESFDASQL